MDGKQENATVFSEADPVLSVSSGQFSTEGQGLRYHLSAKGKQFFKERERERKGIKQVCVCL